MDISAHRRRFGPLRAFIRSACMCTRAPDEDHSPQWVLWAVSNQDVVWYSHTGYAWYSHAGYAWYSHTGYAWCPLPSGKLLVLMQLQVEGACILIQPTMGIDRNKLVGFFLQNQLLVGTGKVNFAEFPPTCQSRKKFGWSRKRILINLKQWI